MDDENALVYIENASLFVLPSVAIYLIWKRSLSLRFILPAAAVFVAAALLVNLYPSRDPHDTAVLIAVHLPIALLLLLGVLYGGPGWRKAGTRLDFVRFAGEVFIYSVLIGLGGVVLIGVSVGVFQFVEIDIETFIVQLGGGVRRLRPARGRRLSGGAEEGADREHRPRAGAHLHPVAPGGPCQPARGHPGHRQSTIRGPRAAHLVRSSPGPGLGHDPLHA